MSSSAGRAVKNAASSAWMQNIPAVAVIIGALTVMGVAQDGLHRLGNEGEPKQVGQDKFDWMMQQRDIRLRADNPLNKFTK